jgi:hypothetical protein
MKNMTIYLAEITKAVDYGTDITVEREAFDSKYKAEAFLFSCGMKTSGFGLWQKPDDFDYEGYVTKLEVK